MKKITELRIRTNANNSFIVGGSTPIVFFGNIKNATVATLGINPSKNEFQKDGKELVEKQRRLETLSSLNANSLSSLTQAQAEKVFDTCLKYFQNNPYKKWFDQLENNILKGFSVSYYTGTACHLDIIQWATDPIWRSLDYLTKKQLIQSNIIFLERQLIEERVEILLINGKEATEIFKNYFKPTPIRHEKLLVAKKTCDIYEFDLSLSTKIIKIYAWSNNLQSTVGITNEMRMEIGKLIRKLYNNKDKSMESVK